MRAADICVLGYDLAAPGGAHEGFHRGGHARRRLPGPARRARHHPHPPALRQCAGRGAPAHTGAVRRAGALSGALRGHRGLPPSGTSFLRSRVAKAVRSGANAFILANHGVLVLGGDEDMAVHNRRLLEKCALDYLLGLLTGERVHHVPAPIREVAFAKLRADQKSWRGRSLRRRLAPPPQPLPPLRRPTARRRGGRRRPSTAAPARRRPPEAPPAAAAPARRGRCARGRCATRGCPAGCRPGHRPTRMWPPCTVAWTPGAPAFTAAAARRHGRVSGLLRHGAAAPKSSPARPPSSSRRRAAQPGLQLSLSPGHRESRGRLPVGRGRQPLHRFPPGRRARPCWAATTPRCASRSSSCCDSCGPVTGLFHEYELKLAELINRYMPSVEMFRMLGSGTEGCHGRHPRGARFHAAKERSSRSAAPITAGATRWCTACTSPAPGRFEAHGIPVGATAHAGDLPERSGRPGAHARVEPAARAARRR